MNEETTSLVTFQGKASKQGRHFASSLLVGGVAGRVNRR
jgi:hypothetical protein